MLFEKRNPELQMKQGGTTPLPEQKKPAVELPDEEFVAFEKRILRLEMQMQELMSYLFETDKFTGKKRLSRGGRLLKGFVNSK